MRKGVQPDTVLREMLIKSTFNQTNFRFIFFSILWHLFKVWVLIYIICSYLRRLVIQNSLKCMETLQIFFRSASKSDRYFFFGINCDLFIELSTLIPLQLENRLWTTIVLFYCCTLIWGLTNNNYNLYLLQFMTVSVNIRLCYICIP